jgi:hypothetical protein
LEFALEAHLRDFLAKNLDRIETGLRGCMHLPSVTALNSRSMVAA